MNNAVADRNNRAVVRRKEAAKMIAVSLSTLRNWTTPGSRWFDSTFPQPIRLGANSVGFVVEEILAWLSSRKPASQN